MTEPLRRTLELFVLTHTHWDREWYRTAEEFRLALVDLVDEVLDGYAGPHFLLDGQAIVLDDYLAVRPERAADLSGALREGRVEAGPWYVLGDNLLPGGEALIRNLLTGRETLRRSRATPPGVLYCPDAFGHPAALPQLAAGFGYGVCVVWRGYGGPHWPSGDVARWRGADDSEVLVYHLSPAGYELGSNLPTDGAGAKRRWALLDGVLRPRATLGMSLVPNGADHHAVQQGREAALQALAAAAAPDPVTLATLGGFAARLLERAATSSLPSVHGELRDSGGYVWSLQGTFGSRAAQKRNNAAAERLLVSDVEPFAALLSWFGGTSRRHEVRTLWRTLLACHPHDTLCGCSIDAVARAMDQRLAEVGGAGALLARRTRLALLRHDAAAARERESEWSPVVVVWNRLPRARGGICEMTIDDLIATVAVGPGSGGALVPNDAEVAAGSSPELMPAGGALPVQELARSPHFSREESPRHYPRNALLMRRRVLAWIPPVAPLGVETIGLSPDASVVPTLPAPVRVDGTVLDNGRLRVWIEPNGALSLCTSDGLAWRDVLAFESVGEQGDLYTHSAVPHTHRHGVREAHEVVRQGPLRGELRLRYRVPVGACTVFSAAGEAVGHPDRSLDLDVLVQLDAGATAVRLEVLGQNMHSDHRLRLVVRTGIEQPEVWADAAFGPVQRWWRAANEEEWAMEARSRTAPLHRYVSCFDVRRGMSVVSDGLAEYEASSAGEVAITLVRAVGELSRNHLPERPGHAGWPSPTPGAQCHGPFAAVLALLPHGPRTAATIQAINQSAEDWLLPLVGETLRSAVGPLQHATGAALEGEGLAFGSCKERDDGSGMVLRCVNLLDRKVEGAWRLADVDEAWFARLDETPLGVLVVDGDRVAFEAPPRAVVTILVSRT